MTTINKFYFHDATSSDTGTLPVATGTTLTATVTATGAATNRSMDATIGTSQVTTTLTTAATKTTQNDWFRRWVSGPIAAQTLSAQTLTYSWAASESNSNAAASTYLGIYLWRPSTGAKIGDIIVILTSPSVIAGLTQQVAIQTATSTSQTAQDGDIIVVEIWNNATQAKATAYTVSIYYDGTTEASNTSTAAYLNFATAVTMFSPATTIPVIRDVSQAVNRAGSY